MYKVSKIGMLIWTAFCFLGSCSGMFKVAQQTGGRDLNGAEAAGVGIGLFLWLIIWAVPMVVLGIVAVVTRPRTDVPGTASEHPTVAPTLCQHCGKYYAGSARFCPICGKPQEIGTSAGTS